MGAYINALREEGTKADLLRELERKIDEIERLRLGIQRCGVFMDQGMSREWASAYLRDLLSDKRTDREPGNG